ncbi:MAG: DNA sulfur modification protein DndD [Oscillospiraceae bacterium]|nr:DNA sulfur modification protein DndD [Oscillospiraceae bacterium]
MKIKKLLLMNFGVYAGFHEIDFTPITDNKPIVLLGGYNGFGKTTVLEAILLCLYGKRSHALSKNKLAYNKYLSKYINRNDSTLETSIGVIFSAEIDSTIVELSVLRCWQECSTGIREELSVSINGNFDRIFTDDWDNQMENLMPIGISRFFLFDGEKVAELVADSTEEKLTQAIKVLLGVNVVEQLEEDLTLIINKNKITKEIEANDAEVKHLQGQKDSLQAELNIIQHKTALLRNENEKKEKRLQTCETRFLSSGGAIFGKQETTLQKRINVEKELRVVQSDLHEKLSGAAPLLMVMDLLNCANDTAMLERDCEILNHEIEGVEHVIEGIDVPELLLHRFERMKESRQTLLNEITDNTLSISPAGRERLMQLCSSLSMNEFRNIESVIARKNELHEQLQESDNYLSVEIDEKKLKKLITEMKSLNRDMAKNQIQIELYEKDIASKEQALNNTILSLDRLTTDRLAQYAINDSSARLAKYSLMAKCILEQYSQKLQQMKTEKLSKKVTEKFHAIVGKRKLIGNILFNPNTLSMELYDDSGKPFSRNQLSAGEQQLLSTAIVWGIVEYTDLEFPMIIDTPLARLDSMHRELFAENYVPNAGKQVIIFSTDAEIVNGLEERLDRFIAAKYLLHYDETTKSTSIKEGYF